MKHTKYRLVTLLSGLLLAVAAHAAGSACEHDAQYYCAESASASGATDCLIDHQKDISDACYNELKQQLQQGGGGNGNGNASGGGSGGGMKACKQDAEQYCQGVEKGGGRIVKCLMDHQKDISDACYNFISDRMQSRKH